MSNAHPHLYLTVRNADGASFTLLEARYNRLGFVFVRQAEGFIDGGLAPVWSSRLPLAVFRAPRGATKRIAKLAQERAAYSYALTLPTEYNNDEDMRVGLVQQFLRSREDLISG